VAAFGHVGRRAEAGRRQRPLGDGSPSSSFGGQRLGRILPHLAGHLVTGQRPLGARLHRRPKVRESAGKIQVSCGLSAVREWPTIIAEEAAAGEWLLKVCLLWVTRKLTTTIRTWRGVQTSAGSRSLSRSGLPGCETALIRSASSPYTSLAETRTAIDFAALGEVREGEISIVASDDSQAAT
jgi:hypothetical protein